MGEQIDAGIMERLTEDALLFIVSLGPGTTFTEFEEAWAATHPGVSMYKEIPDETSGI